MRRIGFSLIFFGVLTILIVGLNLQFRATKTALTIPGTLNTHAIGNIEDYHQYMYIIRRGKEGHLLYHNAYSEEAIPDVLLQPFYHILGLVTGPFKITLYDSYFLMHLVSLVTLLSCVYVLIRTLLSREDSRFLALALVISATGYWTISSLSPFTALRQYLPDYNFDLFVKYHVMQPHHDIATALYIIALIALSGSIYTKKRIIVGGLAGLLLGFIHPYIQLFLFLTLIVEHGIRIILMKKMYWKNALRYCLPILIAIPTTLITYYTLVYVLRFEIGLKGIVTHLERQQTGWSYIVSLGPLFFTSLLSFAYIKKSLEYSLLRLMYIWAYLPIILFFLPDYGIPMNTWRLFQTYQHIPLAILTVFGVIACIKRSNWRRYIIPSIAGLSLLYGSLIYLQGYKDSVKLSEQLVWTVDVPHVVISLFDYLKTHSKPDSVILGGGQLSNLVPEFTNNRVIIGHNGDNRNFLKKQEDVAAFLTGTIAIGSVEAFLKKYGVSYIIFGIDAPFFKNTQYTQLPFLEEVYIEPKTQFSVVAVRFDK